MLAESGFLLQGKPKGFDYDEDNTYRVWIIARRPERALAELEDMRSRIVTVLADTEALHPHLNETGGDLVWPSGTRVQFMTEGNRALMVIKISRPVSPDIWVVSERSPEVDHEVEKWVKRGYHVAVSQHFTGRQPGLVVSMNTHGVQYQGRLPRYPAGGTMVEAWH